MRVNWFSPLPPSPTGIAEYSMHVLTALSRRAEVIVWTDQSEWDPRLERFGEVRCFGEFPEWAEMNKADATFYNIGNNVRFHAKIWEISRQHAGIVILHDTHLQHLFASLYLGERYQPGDFRAIMTRHYGRDGQAAVDAYQDGDFTTDQLSERFPLSSLALDNALGAVVHSSSEVASLARTTRRPVSYLPLPYPVNSALNPAPVSRVDRQADGPPYRITMFGYLGPNRRLDLILRALKQFERRNEFRLHVYGNLAKPERWQRLIRRTGLAQLVTLHGFVSDAELEDALASTHLAINLRYPSMGEASWTQLRLWSHALPSLVTQTGWYATLPENTVAFVRPAHETADIHRHLTRFLSDPQAFACQGAEAFRILSEQHAPEAFADGLLDAARQAEQFRGRASRFRLVERTGEILSQWADVENQPALLGRIANEIRRVAA